jgi:hypothetical protein
MSDTYRRYRAIKQGIMQFYQPRPTGHCTVSRAQGSPDILLIQG